MIKLFFQFFKIKIIKSLNDDLTDLKDIKIKNEIFTVTASDFNIFSLNNQNQLIIYDYNLSLYKTIELSVMPHKPFYFKSKEIERFDFCDDKFMIEMKKTT